MALRDHGHVGHRELQRARALLLGDQARDAAIDLGREEPLGADREETQHPVERTAHGETVGEIEWLELRRNALQLERLLRHVTQHGLELEVHGRGVVRRVVHHDSAVPGDPADVGERDLLALAQRAELSSVLGLEQQCVVLLILRPPDLHHRERRITEGNLADLDLRPRRVHDLLQHVAVPAGALVVDADDGVALAQLDAGADDAVHLLLHLGVAALHRVEIELLDVLALHHAGGRASTHPDAVGRAAQLDNQHIRLRPTLLGVPGVHLADAAREHDGLEPLAALAAGESHPKGARVSRDHRLTELVAVVGGAVRCLDLDLQRRGEVAGVGEAAVLPGELIARDPEVADAVGGRPRHDQRPPARGVHVADAPAGAGLRTGERRHTRWEVVGFGGENDVVVPIREDERRGLAGPRRYDGADRVALDRARVVPECNRAVVGVRLQRVLDQRDEVFGNLPTLDHQPALEEPVARVLAVGLGDVEALDVGRIAADLLHEQVGVVVQVPLVERQAHLAVSPLQGRPTLLQDRDLRHGLRRESRLEALQRLRIGSLGHPVVHQPQERRPGRLGESSAGPQQVAPRPLDTPHPGEPAGVAHGHRVGGPRGREVHPWADLQNVAGTVQHALRPQALRLERLPQEPRQRLQLRCCEPAVRLDVEAELGIDVLDVVGDPLPGSQQERVLARG